MKTIKKTSWQYKLMYWVYSGDFGNMPKSSCSFNFHLLLAILMALPILFKTYSVKLLSHAIGSEIDDLSYLKYDRVLYSILGTALLSAFGFLMVVVTLGISSSKIQTIPTWTLCILPFVGIGIIVGTIYFFKGIAYLYDKIGNLFCDEIKYE